MNQTRTDLCARDLTALGERLRETDRLSCPVFNGGGSVKVVIFPGPMA
jgi:hypothetical protein